MKLRWFIPIALLIPLRLCATDAAVGGRPIKRSSGFDTAPSRS